MTVLAWDGYALGTDSQFSMHKSQGQKLFQLNDNTWCAMAGCHGSMMRAIEWLNSDEPIKDRGSISEISVLHILADGTAEAWHGDMAGPGAPVQSPPYALGSGRDYAMGALGAGATVREAIKITCRFDNTCGGEVCVEEVPTWPGFRDSF